MLDKTIHTQFKILNHTEMIFSSLVLQSDLFFSLSAILIVLGDDKILMRRDLNVKFQEKLLITLICHILFEPTKIFIFKCQIGSSKYKELKMNLVWLQQTFVYFLL